MKSWETVEPDVVMLLNKHYTPGRGGHRIRYIVRHHNAGVLTTKGCWDVWQQRPASAHYQVETNGRIGQLVWDRDTAWHAANALINMQSIGIEHANSGGAAQGWPISDATIEEGAHLAAALCKFYGLGRPEYGKNILDHRQFTGTSCPYHLALGGKYHVRWMQRAQYWYDEMTRPKLTTQIKEAIMPAITLGGVSAAALNEAKIKAQVAAGVAADNQIQLRGPDCDGWDTDWLLEQYEKRPGSHGTIPELLAVTLHEVRELRKEVAAMKEAA